MVFIRNDDNIVKKKDRTHGGGGGRDVRTAGKIVYKRKIGGAIVPYYKYPKQKAEETVEDPVVEKALSTSTPSGRIGTPSSHIGKKKLEMAEPQSVETKKTRKFNFRL